MTESNYQPESRMREIRQSGSEGGGTVTPFSLPLCGSRVVEWSVEVLSVSICFFMEVIHREWRIQAGWILSTQEPCLIWFLV